MSSATNASIPILSPVLTSISELTSANSPNINFEYIPQMIDKIINPRLIGINIFKGA